jgi:ribose 5-phosphate isomerase A
LSFDGAIEALSNHALNLVKDKQIIGLGSGRAATALVKSLGKLVRENNYTIRGVPTSLQIKMIAEKEGISLVEADQIEKLDIVFDGADQIDSNKFVIKGGGGALLRENILFSMAKKNCCNGRFNKICKKFQQDCTNRGSFSCKKFSFYPY